MKVDRKKLELAMARACMNTRDLQIASELQRPTLNGVLAGRDVRPGTIGRVAAALKIDVTEILANE